MTDAPDYSRYTEFQPRMPKDCRRLLISRSPSPRQIKWNFVLPLAVSFTAASLTLFYPEQWEALAMLAVLFFIGGFYTRAQMEAFQLQVFDCGSGLGFKDHEHEAYAAWPDIDRIALARSEDSEWLEVHLKFEAALGEVIEFYAASDGPDARELQSLLNHKLKKGMV